jgi:hypothetical protein
MTPQEFITAWTNTEETLTPISPELLKRFNFSKATFDFLSIAGLPIFSEPNLSFCVNSDDTVYGIVKLAEQFNFGDDKEKYERYVAIGSCRDGDIIAVDTNDNDTILELDHGDLFRPLFFNGSINTLAAFLVLYNNYEKEVLQDKDPEDTMQVFNFSDAQFNALKEKMFLVDPRAIKEGFWKEELDIILSIRRDEFGK